MKLRNGFWIVLACTVPALATAAEPTTAGSAAAASPAAAAVAPAATAPADVEAGGGAASRAPTDRPAEARRAAAPGGSRAAAAGNRGSGRAIDRLELDATQITGNRELPKVMVVVPWKKSDIGDLVGKPVNSLIDEALQPVDREVFRREVAYFGALGPDRPREATPPGANPVTDANAQRDAAGSAPRGEN